jgi:sulfite exporter TauE/SafE
MVYMVVGFAMIFTGAAVVSGRDLLSHASTRAGGIMKAGKLVLGTGSGFRYYPLGLLFGFLPCGLSYPIFIGAAATGGALEGGAFALSFALGTVPALLMFGMVVSYLGARVRGIIYRTGGVLVIAMGLRFLYKGIMFYAHM